MPISVKFDKNGFRGNLRNKKILGCSNWLERYLMCVKLKNSKKVMVNYYFFQIFEKKIKKS